MQTRNISKIAKRKLEDEEEKAVAASVAQPTSTDAKAEEPLKDPSSLTEILPADCWRVILAQDFQLYHIEKMRLISKGNCSFVRLASSTISFIPAIMPYVFRLVIDSNSN